MKNFNGDGTRAGIAADGALRVAMANTTDPWRFSHFVWLAGRKKGAMNFSIGTTRNLCYALHDSSIHAFCAALHYGSLQRIS